MHKDPIYTKLTDLAAKRLGGKVLFATDDFFAEKENLIKSSEPIFIPDKYTECGKWMDGWESRRKRDPGHDWCIIQLAVPGKVLGVNIDTSHFLGNHPEAASVFGAFVQNIENQELEKMNWEAIPWENITGKESLKPGNKNLFESKSNKIFNVIRLNIYPDGGVARLRIYGEVFQDWKSIGASEIDLAAANNGARALLCNDMFFSDMQNLLFPGRGVNMGDGWETKRCRILENRDWVIIKLAHPGMIHKVIVDTAHFKGNYPDGFSLDGVLSTDDDLVCKSEFDQWESILPRLKLGPDAVHEFHDEINQRFPVSHVRFNIYPDGGVSRLRLIGKIEV